MSFSTADIGNMAALVDIDGMEHADAAAKWLADNESTWKRWAK
jgi:glycine betaine/proline transport system substrate-binding protein